MRSEAGSATASRRNRAARPAEVLRDSRNTELLQYYKARNFAQQRRYEEARRLYVQFVRNHGVRDELKGDVLSRLGNCYWLLDRHNMAEQSYRRALACQTEVADRVGASWTRIRFAELEWKAANFSHAHALATEALEDLQELNDVAGIMAARQMIADIYYWECKFSAAERCQLELVDTIPTLTSSQLPLAAAVHRLAEIRRFQGKLRESLRDYEYCRELYQALPAGYELGWTLAGMGDVHRIQGDFQAAYKLSSEALAIFDQLAFLVGMGWGTRAIAEVLRHGGKHDAAIEFYDAAIDLFRRANDSRGLASCIASKAEVALARQDCSVASAMFQEACKILERDQSWYAYARAMRGLAASMYAAGDVSGAAGTLSRAVRAFEGMGNLYQVRLSGLLGAKISIARGDRAHAQQLLEQAIEGCVEANDHAHQPELRSLLRQLQGG
jgi:tetratricopeptide (TPR) repeat protein